MILNKINKSLGLNKENNVHNIQSLFTKRKLNILSKQSSLCRKIFVKLNEWSSWSPELVARCRFEYAITSAFKPLIEENCSKETSKVQTDNENINGRFLNTSLPIIPNIRSLSIQEKSHDLFLNLFNIRTRRGETGGSSIVLKGGPNDRKNRYLKYQYYRMLWLIGAFPSLNKKETEINQIKWCYNAFKKKLNFAPYVDIWLNDIIYGKLKENKSYRYPPSEPHNPTLKIQPVKIIMANIKITKKKDIKEWLKSIGVKDWIEENNILDLKEDYKIVVRFPIKFYLPKKQKKVILIKYITKI
jgi:hypothetical protein